MSQRAKQPDELRFRRQHAARIDRVPTDKAGKTRGQVRTRIEVMYARKQITARQYAAGQEIARLHEIAEGGGDKRQANGPIGRDPHVDQLDAVRAVKKTEWALGPYLWPLVDHVALKGRDLQDYRSDIVRDPRYLMGVLQVALETVADVRRLPGGLTRDPVGRKERVSA